jgi:S1-C subfamily serine protease
MDACRIAAGALVLMAAMLPVSGPAAAAVPRDWVFTQRMALDGRSATLCYDRRSLRREGAVTRVWIRHHQASQVLAEDCRIPPGESDGITLESEILIRCGDRRWMESAAAQRGRDGAPASGNRWRDARSGDYRKLVEQVCARGPLPGDQGTVIGGSGLAGGATAAAPPRTIGPQAPANRPSSGTGFFVDASGNVLTNHHVVETCNQVVVVLADRRWRADVVARNAASDLALLKAGTTPTSYASFRAAAPPRAGEAVTAVGFPLRGLLASGPIVSTGIVNATAGIRDDATRFQISAPVQAGNSGGPVLDAGGNVIGVVVAKLDAMKLARETGDIPQNINFAIKGDVARAFLDAHGVRPRTGKWTRPIDAVGVAAIAKAMTVAVECL